MTGRLDDAPGDALFVALLEAAPEPPADFVPGTAAPPEVRELAGSMSQHDVGAPDASRDGSSVGAAFEAPLDEDLERQAALLEDEARHQTTALAAARGLLLASELWAQAGDAHRAARCADEATRAAPSFTLAQLQLRAFTPWRADDPTARSRWLRSLQGEARLCADEAERSHAAWLLSELARLAGDVAGASAAEDLAQRAGDLRAAVSWLVDRLLEGENPLAVHLPPESPLRAAALRVAELRNRRPADDPDALVHLDRARRHLAAGRWRESAEHLTATAEELASDALLDLAASLAAHDAQSRPVALRALRQRLAADTNRALLRTFAARAVEQADWGALNEALDRADPASGSFDLGERIVLALIGGGALQVGDLDLDALSRQSDPALAASLAEHSGDHLGASPRALEATLGSRLAPTQRDELALFLEELPDDDPLRHVLATEIALAARDPDATVDALERLALLSDLPALHEVVGLLHELAGHADRAADAYGRAHELAPELRHVRALADTSGSAPLTSLLTALARSCRDPDRAALLWLEAALRAHPREALDLLGQATLSEAVRRVACGYAAFLAARTADAVERREWLSRGAALARSPRERALWLLRQPDDGSEVAADASRALRDLADLFPEDLALQEYCERTTRCSELERAEHRLRAAHADTPQAAWLSAEAAMRAWGAGEPGLASRALRRLLERHPSPFATAFAAMLAHDGGDATEPSAALLEQAASAEAARRDEALEALARLDGARGNQAGRREWLRALLAGNPSPEAAVRAAARLEADLLHEGNVRHLDPAGSALAEHLSPADRLAYRLHLGAARLLDGDLRAARRWLEPLARSPRPPALALHALEIHARQIEDAETLRWLCALLGTTADTAAAAAASFIEAAFAAARLGRRAEALAVVDRALRALPDDLVAAWLRWELVGASGLPAVAARAGEKLARRLRDPSHRRAALLEAARSWVHADLAGEHDDAAEAALREVLTLAPADTTAFERLRALIEKHGDARALAELLEGRRTHASTPEEKLELHRSLAACYLELQDPAEERAALEAWLALEPDATVAWRAHARASTTLHDPTAARRSWERFIELTPPGAELTEAKYALALLLDEHLAKPRAAAELYEAVLLERPEDRDVLARLVRNYARLGMAERAISLQTKLIQLTQHPREKLTGALDLAQLYEDLAGDAKRAVATLERARKAWPTEPAPLAALVRFLERQGEDGKGRLLVERTTKDTWRKLESERIEASALGMLATLAELQGLDELAAGAEAARRAWVGEDGSREGAGASALGAQLDDLLAPTEMSPPLRALLRKTGRAFDAAFPVAVAAQRVESGVVLDELRELSRAAGLGEVALFVTPSLGARCLPARAALDRGAPHQMLIGPALEDLSPDQRTFLLLRGLKLQQSGAGALARSRSRDSWPMLAALLNLFAPNWVPAGIDQEKFLLARQQLEKGLRAVGYDDDVPFLVLEAIGTLTPRAQHLGEAARLLPNRAALLGTGSLGGAVEAFARLADRPLAAAGPARWRWLNGHAEARDLILFSASRACAEARVRLGLVTRDSLPEASPVHSLPPRPPQRSLAGVPPRPPPRRS